jgi:outer membrane protein
MIQLDSTLFYESPKPMKRLKLHIALFALSLPSLSMATQLTPEQTTNIPSKDWTVFIGAGLFGAPAFLGAKEYNLSIIPNVRATYKNLFFASVNGIGANLINQGEQGFKAGPLIRYRFARHETNGSNPFKIAGPESTALQGLGDVNGVLELGGFAEYTWQTIRTHLDIRQGVTSPYGLLGTFDVAYSNQWNQIRYSIGPHVTAANKQYNNTYFGINQTQSTLSGLSTYNASAGLVSYGIGSMVIVPITRYIASNIFLNYDRITGQPADSPLVTERGAKNQWVGGVSVSYRLNF